MHRRRILLVPVACLLLVAITLYFGRDQLKGLPELSFVHKEAKAFDVDAYDFPDNGTLSRANLTAFIKAILNPNATHLPRLECPAADLSRYEHLRDTSSDRAEIQYFFALNLRECVHLLPRLIGSVVDAIRFLGPRRCALSIVEGHSPDGTGEVLAALRPALDALTTTYYFSSSDIDSQTGDRVVGLAALRNLALQPLRSAAGEPRHYSPASTAVVFLNDVAICLEDILELLHQRRTLGADMVCAVDWTYPFDSPDPTFYDVWVTRSMAGDAFFRIGLDGNWDLAGDLLWNDAATKARFDAHLPFQVYSCWDGAAAFTAAPVLRGEVEFRSARDGECFQGEPQLFCKDLWFRGYGRIAIVPSVNLEYSDEKGKKIKDAKGYTSQWVVGANGSEESIDWQREPPEQVLCLPSWDNQYWEPWNVTY